MQRVAPWLKAMNVVLSPTIANRRNKVDKVIAHAVAEAESKTDGTAHGDEQFIEEMRFLLSCFADVDRLTPAGWIGTVGDLGQRLENRMRIRKLHALHPEIADEPIERPIVVVGLPRTGTTLAHHVLAQPEAHRAPLMWELMHCDLADIPESVRERYIKQAEQVAQGASKASPMMPKIHPLGAEKPEECVFVLPHGLMFVVRAHMPRYEQWMLDRDYTPDYQYLKQALQVLQHKRPRRRWVLKSPAHLWSLETLFKVFPDAQVVWTHRDPSTVMGSLCSLVETSQAVHTRSPDPKEIGRVWLGMLATGVARALTARENLRGDSIIDVSYRRLAEAPDRRFPELFQRLDVPWGPTERENLDAAQKRAGSSGEHLYDLTRYGIGEAEVAQAFGDYADFVAGLGSR